MLNNPRKIISILIVLISINSANSWTRLPIGNTFFWWFVYVSILICFIRAKKYFSDFKSEKEIKVVRILLIWNVISIIRGTFVAENYWEWKSLAEAGMVLLLPLSINISRNKDFFQFTFYSYLRYSLPLFFVFIFFMYDDAIGHFLAPVSFLLLFFPDIPKRWKFVIIFFFAFVLIYDIEARSNIIKFVVSFTFSMILYLPKIVLKVAKFIRLSWLILMGSPIILLFLGVTGVFNVFKIDKYIDGKYEIVKIENGEYSQISLKDDTRTGIYMEVLQSAVNNDYIILGRTPARGNDSMSFGGTLAEELHTGKRERFSNEASILNIFTWTGLVGVILYFLVFLKASYLAVNKSNNIYAKIMGLYVAFRWVFAWIEDFSRFDLFYCSLWLSIGICFSSTFRGMTNGEVKIWIKGIFDGNKKRINSFNRESYPKNNLINETNSSTYNLP